MKFLQSLSESRLLASKQSYHKFTGRQIAELVYLHLISLRILASEPVSKAFAADYALRTVRYLGFSKWYQNATDVHLLLHALIGEDVEMKLPQASQDFRETLYFDEHDIRTWLREIGHSHINETRTHRLFLRIDAQFQIKNASMKAIRRLVQDWPNCSTRQKQLAMTRLLQMMRVRARQSDLLVQLEKVSTQLRLELHDVANMETGDAAPHDGSDPAFIHAPVRKSFAKGELRTAAKAMLGYDSIRSLKEGQIVHEDRALVVIESPSILQLLRMKESAGEEGVRAIVRDGKVFAWDAAYLSYTDAAQIVGEGINAVLWNGYIETDREDGVEEIWENQTLRDFYEGAALIQIGENEEFLMEDDGGATCAADIATVNSVLGDVQRRKPKPRKKKK